MRDIAGCEEGDRAACARIEEYSGDVASNNLDLDEPAAKLKKISEDFSRMVMEKDNGDKTVMEVMSFKPDIGLQDEVFTKDFLVKK